MDMNLILASIGVFLVVIIALVIILLVAKAYLSPSGNVNITINGKDYRKPRSCNHDRVRALSPGAESLHHRLNGDRDLFPLRCLVGARVHFLPCCFKAG